MRRDVWHFAHKYQALTREGRASPECGRRGDNRRITVEIEYRADVGSQLHAAVKQATMLSIINEPLGQESGGGGFAMGW